MLDPNLIYKNIDKISEKLSKKGYNLNSQEFKTLYENRKDIIQKTEALKEEQNIFTKKISKEKLSKGIEVENLLATETNFLKSVSEARRALKENSISINKKRISQNIKITKNDLINGKYTLLQRGRKNYYLVIVN